MVTAARKAPTAPEPDAPDLLGEVPMPWLQEPLKELLARHQGHALLIQGHPGDGALALAWRLAKAWLCEASAESALRPCGHCPACHLFRGHAHGDFRLLTSEWAASEWGLPVDIDGQRKPSRQVKVDDVRQALGWLSTTAGRGQGKVLLIHPAEAMNQVSASALLKSLEEPPSGVRIILSTADAALLMPTILSRCQQVRAPRPDAATARTWLQSVALPVLPACQEAPGLLAASAGRPLDALRWAAEGFSAKAWQALPQALPQGQSDVLSGWPVRRMVDACLKLAHDAALSSQGVEPHFFAAAAMPPPAPLPAILAWQTDLLRLAKDVDHPWFEPLAADALAQGAAAVWQDGVSKRAMKTAKAQGSVRGSEQGSERGSIHFSHE